jgi:adenine deaminase
VQELTLESLARRLEEVERRLNERQPSVMAPTKDWQSVVGISEMTDFSRLMQAEMDVLREADRRAAEAEDCE